ncbi:sulfatase-like hydrolase/transferase [Planctomycetes bacterium CA13]
MSRSIVFCSFAVLVALVATSTTHAERPDKPNIVHILTDDLGWQDLKCYDIDAPSPMDTPNLDAFSKRGVMFWQAYSPAPTCAPSRCAIMSGNHPARAQKTHVVGGAPPHARNPNARMMDPWYSGRMPAGEMTLPKALKTNGYVTGHVGKWHMAIDHHAFPQPEDQGFDFTRSNRGAHAGTKDRLAEFATNAVDDPYRLDENGFPYHQNSEDALEFLSEHKDQPFYLYYATWLVHAPIHTRSKALLDKYVERLGVDPRKTVSKETAGQLNPFYCAMVEMLDYYVGQVFKYLDETEDPRWPGHNLSENTYIIFTSDNGGMEGGPSERYTDNHPLDRGKISAKEGGTRVPLFIAGPGIQKGVQTNVVVNGLDFYPTILSLTGTAIPRGKHLDGCDLSDLLLSDPTNPALVKKVDGGVRDTMVWHFPHGVALESTIRIGDYKLIRNYDHVMNAETPELELFQLYQSVGDTQTRVDIEEAINLADSKPELTVSMNQKLTEILTEMKASYPYYNPDCVSELPGHENVCTVLSHTKNGNLVEFAYQENGAKVQVADLIYTLNGGERYEEWYRTPVDLQAGMKAVVELPAGTTHYILNLIDENDFLQSFPEIGRSKAGFAASAISVQGGLVNRAVVNKSATPSPSLKDKDANQDGEISADEYIAHFVGGFDRKDKNKDGVLSPGEHSHPSFGRADQNQDEQLTREEFTTIFSRQFELLDKDKNGFISANEMERK